MRSRLPDPAAVLGEVGRTLTRSGRAVLCHIVRTEGSTPGKPGWRLLVRPDGSAVGNLGGGAFEAMVKADAAAKLAGAGGSEVKRYYLTEEAVKGEPTGMVCGGLAEVFLERLEAPPLLAVLGGGPVGQALVRAAGPAGFDCLVVDDRSEFVAPELFPEETEVATVGRGYEEPFLQAYRERDLFVAVVTRCWETDVAALSSVLHQAPPRLVYLGLMGSGRKIERVRREVEGKGLDLSAVELHAPIGLPLGGESPGEIAVSIAAELIRERYRARREEPEAAAPEVAEVPAP